ncbi:hypothetical protein [Endozoicomonas arenosclerae]|uniref:hypothetical protein n=1 Tax=Endozoicomonas arenosclerae TaxID=1633495 RepID=UPI0007811A5E|nr:hypothetical protein [Endozoicomonas arenosclerae]
MLSSIKYSKLRLRDVDQPVSPKGPEASTYKTLRIDLAGNILEMIMPRHNPPSSSHSQVSPTTYKIMQFGSRTFSTDSMPDQSWMYKTLLHRVWSFYGPWFTGILGDVSCSISILEESDQKTGTSYFHPKVFEYSIYKYLTSLYENKTGSNIVEAPVKWEVLKTLPVPSASFYVLPTRKVSGVIKKVIFPISDQHLVEIHFRFSRSMWDRYHELHNLIDPEPMYQSVKTIISSLDLRLSSDSKKQLDEIKVSSSEILVTDTFPPINWSSARPAIT